MMLSKGLHQNNITVPKNVGSVLIHLLDKAKPDGAIESSTTAESNSST